MKGKEL